MTWLLWINCGFMRFEYLNSVVFSWPQFQPHGQQRWGGYYGMELSSVSLVAFNGTIWRQSRLQQTTISVVSFPLPPLPPALLADIQTPPALWRSDLRTGRPTGSLRGGGQAEGGWDYNLRRAPLRRPPTEVSLFCTGAAHLEESSVSERICCPQLWIFLLKLK